MRNNSFIRCWSVLITILLLGLSSSLWASNVQNYQQSGMLPGNIQAKVTALALAEHNEAITTVFKHAFAETQSLAASLANSGSNSDIAAINARASYEPVSVSADTIRLLKLARKLNRLTKGHFSVVSSDVGNAGDVKLSKKDQTVRFATEGMQIDVSPLVEGYLADRFMQIVWDANIDNAMVEVGNATRSVGYDSVGPWKKTVADMAGKYVGRGVAISFSNAATATVQTASSAHAPKTGTRTGDPEASGVRSATVIAKDAAMAKGIADAIYGMKPADGIALANRLSNVQAVIRDSEGKLLRSKGL